jgi:hypothetical protein
LEQHQAEARAMQLQAEVGSIRQEQEAADENVVKRYKRRLEDAEARALAAKTDALGFEVSEPLFKFRNSDLIEISIS